MVARAVCAAALAALWLSLGTVPSRAADDGPQEPSIDRLKRSYLLCERASTLNRLSSGDIARCSIVYEQLKARAFDGDFERFLAWSRSQVPLNAAKSPAEAR